MDSMVDGERPQVSIDEALAGGWFELWYQPKIDLRQKCLAGAEALARIRHPVHGDLAPGAFTPVVDAAGIARLTEYALCSVLTNWSLFDQAGFQLHLSLNVPARLLRGLPVLSIVEQYRPFSDRWAGVILEVTEGRTLQDLAFTEQAAADWRSRGVTIAIDEVGTGTSLESLHELPFGELKLDRALVKDCAIDADNAGACQTVIDLAHRFGGAAVATGVESQTDLRALMAMGCDFAQGPVIAPVMSQEQFLDMLLQRFDRRSPQAPAANDGAADAGDAIGRVA